MITSPARGADRAVGAYGPPPRALSASTALVVLLLGSLALRLTIAYILFPASGFGSDIGTLRGVGADHGASRGPAASTRTRASSTIRPATCYVLWPIGLLAQGLGGGDPSALATDAHQAPAHADRHRGRAGCCTGWCWAGRGHRGAPRAWRSRPRRSTCSTRSPGTTRRSGARPIPWARSWCCSVSRRSCVATARVPRSWPCWRRWSSPSSGWCSSRSWRCCSCGATCSVPARDPGTRRGARHGSRGWLAREQGPLRLVTSAVVALVTFHVLALPFGMGIPDYLQLMGEHRGGYEYLTRQRLQPVGAGRRSRATSRWRSTCPLVSRTRCTVLGPCPAVVVGALLLVAGFLYGLANAARGATSGGPSS